MGLAFLVTDHYLYARILNEKIALLQWALLTAKTFHFSGKKILSINIAAFLGHFSSVQPDIQMILAASDTLNSYYRCQVTISMILHYAPISHKIM
jgi:hypothetical protein